MKFNYDLLEETKEQIKSMNFFKDNIKIDEEEYEIIHDFEQALENAFDRYDFEYGDGDGYTWVDILEGNMAEVWKVIYQYDNYAELSAVVRGVCIHDELEHIEYTIDDDSVQEEIGAELELCARSRFVCGKDNKFFESLFNVYKLGGWPCGWNNGKMIVYVPDAVSM